MYKKINRQIIGKWSQNGLQNDLKIPASRWYSEAQPQGALQGGQMEHKESQKVAKIDSKGGPQGFKME